MIDYQTARTIVEKWFPALERLLGVPVHILDDRTVECEWGWLIYWHAKDLSKLAPERAARSNPPFLVDKVTGACVTPNTSNFKFQFEELLQLRAEKLANLQQQERGEERHDRLSNGEGNC